MVKMKSIGWSAVLTLVAASLYAQVAGRVTGSVVDASGAAVPDARVTLQLPGSGSPAYSAVTTNAGDFTIPAVNSGEYDLAIEKPGFLKVLRSQLKVDAGRATDVQQIKLDIAAVTQTVEVSTATQTVQTSNAEVSTTIARDQIHSLPVINRSPLGFLLTQAGINFGQGSTTINGQRPTFTNVTIDGVNIQDNYIRTNDLDFLPNLLLLDQVAEVTVSSSNASSASFGGSSQVAFVTPSGGNQFHGSGYWSNRNSDFAANTWFNNQSGTARPFLNQNQIGGTIGGPIMKNKLFFYSNYEAFRLKQQASTNATILTADARNGIFTYVVNGAPQKVNLFQVAGVQADPAAAALLAKVPGPENINNTNTGDSTSSLLRNTGGYNFVQRSNRTRDNATFRGDYLPTAKHNVTVTYIWNRDILDRPDQDVTFNLVPNVTNNDPVKLLSTAWRWTPKGNLTNEARFGFNWAPAVFLAVGDVPSYYLSGTVYRNPINSFRTQGRNTDSYNFADNVSWVHGAHSVTFGVQYQKTRVETYNDAGITPSYGLGIGSGNPGLTAVQLPGASATDQSAANNLLATLAGYVTSYTQSFNVSSRTSGFVKGYTNLRHDKFDEYAAYAQDSWKVSRRFTASLGVRWDYYTPVDEADGLFLGPVLNGNAIATILNPNTVLDFTGGNTGRQPYPPNKKNFAPNLGVAYDLFGNGKTALRAGYSVSFVNDNAIRAAEGVLSNAGLRQTTTGSGLAGTLSAGLPAISIPAYKVPRTLADNYALSSTATVGIVDPTLRTPYVQQWNIGIQQSVKNFIVDVRYVGNHATKELRGLDYNQISISQILPDFLKAQQNAAASQRAGGAYNPTYNAGIAGSQPLNFFALLPNSGSLTSSANIGYLQTGAVADMANNYMTSRTNGNVSFYPNPAVQSANMLTNFSNQTYNALQVEANRRFSHGFQIQANYVYSRTLSDSVGSTQTNLEPLLDNNNPGLEKSRPQAFDVTHVIKANGVWTLPFGPGQRFKSGSGIVNKAIEGWSVAGIFVKQSGTPFGVYSGRGTLNRSGNSGFNTVNTTLNKSQLDQLFQFRMTGNGPVFVPDSIINPNDKSAVAADGAAPFAGQVFFQPAAGTLGTLQRNYFSGPWIWDLDAKIGKITKIGEHKSIEFRADATNVFNHPTFIVNNQTITSANFGKITGTFNPGSTRRLVQFALYFRF